MQKISVKLIHSLIKKTIGKGSHQLHEPLFLGNEIKFIKDTIKKNFVSTSGEYVNKFEKKKAIASNCCLESIERLYSLFKFIL